MPTALPLVPSVGTYRFATTLEAYGDGAATEPREYVIRVRWNDRAKGWFLDVLKADETPLRVGLRLVLGAIIGGRCVDLEFPAGALYPCDLSGEGVEAGFDDLGTRVVVYYYTVEELAAPDA